MSSRSAPSTRGDAPWQFSLRQLASGVFALSILLGTSRIGAGATLFAGLPLAMLGYLFLSGRRIHASRFLAEPRSFFAIALRLCGILSALAVLCYGWPIDAYTWCALCGGFAWIVAIHHVVVERKLVRMKAVPLLPAAFYLWLIFPAESAYLQDIRGARTGVQIGGDFSFGRDTANTRILEDHLGPLSPLWRRRGSRSLPWGLGVALDGGERINSVSIIQCEYLHDTLEMLPHRKARQQVLRCLTDPGNLLRVHQSMLLTALYVRGYPPGEDPESWWRHHHWVFQKEADAAAALSFVQGWTARLLPFGLDGRGRATELQPKVAAAIDQETGRWGADEEIRKFWNASEQQGIVFRFYAVPEEASSPVNRITWWPAESNDWWPADGQE